MNTLKNITRFVVIGLALTGCASTGNVHIGFAVAPHAVEAPRAAEAPAAVTVTSATIIGAAVIEETAPAPAESVTLDSLPADTMALIAAPAHAHEFAESFTLAQHVPAVSFHCVSGEESLGCAEKPATPGTDYIERNANAIFGSP